MKQKCHDFFCETYLANKSEEFKQGFEDGRAYVRKKESRKLIVFSTISVVLASILTTILIIVL